MPTTITEGDEHQSSGEPQSSGFRNYNPFPPNQIARTDIQDAHPASSGILITQDAHTPSLSASTVQKQLEQLACLGPDNLSILGEPGTQAQQGLATPQGTGQDTSRSASAAPPHLGRGRSHTPSSTTETKTKAPTLSSRTQHVNEAGSVSGGISASDFRDTYWEDEDDIKNDSEKKLNRAARAELLKDIWPLIESQQQVAAKHNVHSATITDIMRALPKVADLREPNPWNRFQNLLKVPIARPTIIMVLEKRYLEKCR